MNNTIYLEFPSKRNLLSCIRKVIRDIITKTTNCDKRELDRLELVSDEICTNAYEHGSHDKDALIKIYIETNKDNIEMKIENSLELNEAKNNAIGIQDLIKFNKKKFELNKNKLQVHRGRGLAQIVENWVDKIEFYDLTKGNVGVKIIKKLDSNKI